MKHGAWPLQQELRTLLETKRFTVIVAHRRFGKTMLGITRLLNAATRRGGRRRAMPIWRRSSARPRRWCGTS